MALTAPRRLSAAERREAILDAAKPVFGRDGYHAATTREIAASAGVSEALLYQHFPGKRDLFEAVIERGAADLEQRIVDALSGPDPLAAGLESFFGFVDQEADLYRVFFRQALQTDPAFQALYARLAGRLTELVAASLQAPGTATDRELLAHALAGMVSELALWWVEGRRVEQKQMIAHAARMARAMFETEVGVGNQAPR